MERSSANRSFKPLLILFAITSVVFLVSPPLEFLWGMNKWVMFFGNLIIFAATATSFYLFKRSLRNDSPHAFMRMIYGGLFAKMMICIFAALIYIMIVQKNVSKGGIFGCMVLYFTYSFLEISIILKLSRRDRYVKK